jgi:hypothetical protein
LKNSQNGKRRGGPICENDAFIFSCGGPMA